MLIPPRRLEQIVAMYHPDHRGLLSAIVERDYATGIFQFPQTPCTTAPVDHTTVLEAQLAFNQLMYAAFSVWAWQGDFGKVIKPHEYLACMKKNVVIAEYAMRFRRKLPPNQKYEGKITQTRVLEWYGTYHIHLDIEFADKGVVGNAVVAFITPTS